VDVAVQSYGRFFWCPGSRGFQFTLSQFGEFLTVFRLHLRWGSAANRSVFLPGGGPHQPSEFSSPAAALFPGSPKMSDYMKLIEEDLAIGFTRARSRTEAMYGSHMSKATASMPLKCFTVRVL